MNKSILQPSLRFNQFSGNWNDKSMKSIINIKNGKSQKKIEDSNGKYPILATSGQIGKTNSFLYNKESVLIGRKGTIDRPYYINEPFWTVDTLFFTELKNGINGYFVFSLFQTVNWKKYNTSTGVPSLTSKSIYNINIRYPKSKNEQIKISNFFQTLDKLINLQNQKLNQLKHLKRGYLQKLYPSNEASLPRIRFTKFTSMLRKTHLKNIAYSKSSKISIKEVKNNGEFPVYDVNKKIGYLDEFKSKEKYISIIKDGSNAGRTKIMPSNSSIISTMEYIYHKNSDLKYLFYAIGNINFAKYRTGTGIPHIYFKDYSNEMIMVPSLPEQQQIGSFFQNLDHQIELQQSKLNHLEQLKKGYLQNMFI